MFNEHVALAYIMIHSVQLFLKNEPTPASFSFIFSLFKQIIQFLQKNQNEKISIHYTAPGFVPTTFQT